MLMRPAERPEKTAPVITLELPDEMHRRLVESFSIPFGESVENTALFLIEQAMAAPPEAKEWMIANRLKRNRSWEPHPQPNAVSAFEAHGNAVRASVLAENTPAIELASAVARFIETRKAQPKP